VKAAPTGDSGDAVERLQDEQWQILELLDTYARYQRDPNHRAVDAARLASLISTLLRVHCELESMLLHAQPSIDTAYHAALAQVDARRSAVLDALERTEALSTRDPTHRQAMAALAQRVRAWFQADEHELFARLRHSRLDLAALDREMAVRQEALLSAGSARTLRTGAARPAGSALG
jgi:hypothetical protein